MSKLTCLTNQTDKTKRRSYPYLALSVTIENNAKPMNKGSLFTKRDGSLWRKNNICLLNVCLSSFCLGSKAHFCDVTQWSINFPGWKGFFNSFLTQETVHELVKCDHSNELLWEWGGQSTLLSSGKILKCRNIQESHWAALPARVLFIMLYWQVNLTFVST